MKKCDKCSNVNRSEATFCWYCGASFSKFDKAERRKFKRFKISMLMRHRVSTQGSPAPVEPAIAKDISLGGILFSTPRKFPVGAEIEVSLKVPTAGDKEVKATVKIAHVEELVPGNWYNIGASFSEMNSQSREEIEKYVEYLERRNA